MDAWTGFVIGLVGSLHCIGMCGPIVIALPGRNTSRLRFLASRLIYNSGRVISYTILGVIAGLLGASLSMAGFQQGLSIGLGILILLGVILPSKFASRLFPSRLWTKTSNRLKQLWGKLFSNHSLGSMLLIGFLNGFLPCGFVYVGMAGAASTGSIQSSMLFMALFGLGTFPVMLATAFAGNFISLKIRNTINKLIPVGAVILATLLIIRGLSLGIPYLSPKFSTVTENGEEKVQVDCCHPGE